MDHVNEHNLHEAEDRIPRLASRLIDTQAQMRYLTMGAIPERGVLLEVEPRVREQAEEAMEHLSEALGLLVAWDEEQRTQ